MPNPPGKKAPSRLRVPAWARHLAKFALGAGAIWALVHTGTLEPKLLGRALLRHPGLGLLAMAEYALLVLLVSWARWFMLLRRAGLDVGAGRSFSLQMIGLFFNSLIPGGTGGDLVKGYYLFRENEGNQSLALTSIAMDRFVGLYGILSMGMIMTALSHGLWRDSPALRLNSLFYLGVFLAYTAVVALFFSPLGRFFLEHPGWHNKPGGRFLKAFSVSLSVYRRAPWTLLLAVVMTLVVDFGLILLYYLFALALDLPLGLLGHGFVVPTLTMINGIPISPMGLGVGEAAGEMLYRKMGLSQGGSEVLALVHLCILVFCLAGAPFYFLFKARLRAIPAELTPPRGDPAQGVRVPAE